MQDRAISKSKYNAAKRDAAINNSMSNDIYITIAITMILLGGSITWLGIGLVGLVLGVLYAQLIEWFVHGWIQHHRFKIFKAYRDNHMYHHRKPNEPLAVQPVTYFIIGSIALLLPFYWIDGFVTGYLIAYVMINVIHQDLHTTNTILPTWLWKTSYFKRIVSHHEAHHKGVKLGYTTHSVTNPYMDIVFSKIRLTNMNDWIAKHLKI